MSLIAQKTIGALALAATILVPGTDALSQTSGENNGVHTSRDLCFEAQDPKACIRAGEAYETGKGVPKSVTEAIKLYARACEPLKSALGCTLQGSALFNHAKTPGDRVQARPFWTKGCEAENARACNGLGLLLEDENVGQVDLVKAFAFFKQACDLGAPRGCGNAAYAYDEGRGVTANPAMAASRYRSACEGNVSWACYHAGNAYVRGNGVDVSFATANAMFEKGCALDDGNSCHEFGYSFSAGEGVPKDLKRAIRIWRASCDKKHDFSCFKIVLAYIRGEGVKVDHDKAIALSETLCTTNKDRWTRICHAVGHLYWDTKNLGTFKRDFSKAQQILEELCARKHEDSCSHVEDLKLGKARATKDE